MARAANGGVAGAKLWLLWPPRGACFADAHVLEWLGEAAKAERDTAREAGLTPLLAEQHDALLTMVRATRLQLRASGFGDPFDGGVNEASAFWQAGGVWNRVRPDCADFAKRVVWDLKSTADLADPEKRTRADLLDVLHLIARFGAFGQVTLGLNLKEAQQVAEVLQLPAPDKDEASLRSSAAAIREKLGVATVVVHPRESAACATAAGTAWVPGPYTDKPLITTGAGDHFNGGFSQGQLLGLDPEGCLALGVCTSGHYVRTGISPTLADLETFLASWA
jgi:hypothetical protein